MAARDLADARRLQRLQVAHRYGDLVAAQGMVSLTRAHLDDHQRLPDAGRRRQAAGDLAVADVSRLAIERARAASDAAQAHAALAQARQALRWAIGDERLAPELRASDPASDMATIDRVYRRLTDPVGPDPTASIDRRADVLAQAARLRAVERQRELADSLRRRDLTVGVQLERSPSMGGSVLGVSASVPLMVHNDFLADVIKADAQVAAQREELDRARLMAVADVGRARIVLDAARDRALRMLNDAVPEARQVAQAIEFGFNRGASSLADLFDSRRQLHAVQVEALSAQAEFDKACASYRGAIASEPEP